jgi:hypothetical protein
MKKTILAILIVPMFMVAFAISVSLLGWLGYLIAGF